MDTAHKLKAVLQAAANQWEVELPRVEVGDADFGGCRCIEGSYRREKQIGEGTYGEVFLAENERTGEKVALKKIRMDNEKEGFPITAIREIKLLKGLEHENVICLKEIVRSQVAKCNGFRGSIYMVFDYMDHDLTGLMERRGYKMETSHVKCYMKQLLKGLHYCHEHGVLHRDLKASNLLINNKGCLKLGDFGLARAMRDKDSGRYTNRVITLWYRPPELILGATDYGKEIDLWSVGCIFAELLIGKPLFPGKDEADQLERISKIMGSPTEQTLPGLSKLPQAHMVDKRYKENRLASTLKQAGLKEDAIKLLSKLICMDPKKRMSAYDATKDQYFWTEPLPSKPEDLPTFDASHELDMKQLRQAKKAGGAALQGPDGKRPRHSHRPAGDAPHPQQAPRSLPAAGTHMQSHREDNGREGGGQRRDGRQEWDERRDGRYDGRDVRRDERPGWDGRDTRGPPHGYERGYERGDRGAAAPSGRSAGYEQAYAPHPQAFGASYSSAYGSYGGQYPLQAGYPAAYAQQPPPAQGYGGYAQAPASYSMPPPYSGPARPPPAEGQAPNWVNKRR